MLPVAASSSIISSAAASHGYTRAKGDEIQLADEPHVHNLIFQRRQAKKNHQFDQADKIREELKRDFHVELFDKTMIWKVAGMLPSASP